MYCNNLLNLKKRVAGKGLQGKGLQGKGLQGKRCRESVAGKALQGKRCRESVAGKALQRKDTWYQKSMTEYIFSLHGSRIVKSFNAKFCKTLCIKGTVA